MEDLQWIWQLLGDWVPTLIVLLVGIGLVWAARYLLLERWGPPPGQGRMTRQILVVTLVGIVLVVFILSLPIGDSAKGQLLSLLGLLITAAVALSSTTLLGNAMAGFMLRAIDNFGPGDFIIVNDHRGRVSDKGWLRTEIQTERRDLTNLPNLYLIQNPMTVVRSSGTYITAKVSLGYDVSRERIEECLIRGAERAELEEPFVLVIELGDFSVTYQVAGLLKDAKFLISAESKLRKSMLDALHEAGIEIVSPTFMNQRQLDESRVFIPKEARSKESRERPVEDDRPESRIFDKADQAESDAKVEERLKAVVAEIEEIKKADDADEETAEAKLEDLKQKKAKLEEQVELLAERKKEREKEEQRAAEEAADVEAVEENAVEEEPGEGKG
jgi:small-conductance mechanosensitive channel